MSKAMKWQKMDTAPKDDMVILDVGFPYAVVGIWNECEDEWVYSNMQVNINNGKWNDPYFENEYEKDTEVKGWMPLPEVSSRRPYKADYGVFIKSKGDDTKGE